MVDDGEDVQIPEGHHGRPATPSVDMIQAGCQRGQGVQGLE